MTTDPDRYGSLRFTHADARQLEAEVQGGIEKIAASYRRQGYSSQAIDAELTLILGRSLLRRGLDFLPAAAEDHIHRLEVAVAAAEANVSIAKIAEGSIDGTTPRGGNARVRGIAEPYVAALAAVEITKLITEPGWRPKIAEYLAGMGYQIASMDQQPDGLIVDVVRLRNGNGAHR